jgi:hypothetical protein
LGLSFDVTPLIERLCDAVSKRRERDRKICMDALDCIHNESSNFKRILADKPYGKDLREPKARTQCEQELRRPADERKVAEVLGLIEQLESRLEWRTRGDE